MSFKYHNSAFYITLIIILVLFISVLAILIVDVEVNRYSFDVEIINKEIYHYDNKVRGTYLFYLRDNDITIVKEVDEETFEQYNIGDWIEIEITNYEKRLFHHKKQKTEILGTMIED